MSTLWKIIEAIVRWFLNLFAKLFHKDLSEETIQSFLQFVKFGIVGVSNTVVNYLIYAGTLLLLRKIGIFPEFDYVIAQAVAFILSVLWSFYWNNKMVFTVGENQTRNIWKALAKTYVSYSFTGLFLNSILLVLWVRVLHISEFIAPLINLIVSVPVNFFINKYWAFKSE